MGEYRNQNKVSQIRKIDGEEMSSSALAATKA
jgi:hypothetical protein